MAPLLIRRRRISHRWCGSVMLGFCALVSLSPAQAADSSGPWECSSYTGDAHSRCLQALIDIQREKISKLEAEVQVQQNTVGQLKEQADRQNAMTAELQRQMSERSSSISTYSYIAPGYGYMAPGLLYGYPSVGFGLYLGRPWLYGSPFYGRPYAWGPRYYRPYFGRWHRRW